MTSRPIPIIILGAVLVAVIGYLGSASGAAHIAQNLTIRSNAALDKAGIAPVSANFHNRSGSPTRHPMLAGGEELDEGTRARAARIVANVSGVGGIRWQDGWANASSDVTAYEPLHCQEDVEGLLRTRSIRFEESSAELVEASDILLGEVAEALRPCLGSIIAINGHTDRTGSATANIELSLERARTVRDALIARGIPHGGLRVRGVGSKQPVKGLNPEDPANRRIEFSVLRIEPLHPTPVDTPGPR